VNVNVSGPVRVFALLGGLAALAMGAWFFLLGGGVAPSTSEPVKVIEPLHARKHAAVAAVPKAKAKPKPARPIAKPARPAASPKRATKPQPRPATPLRPKLVNPEKLPVSVARALMRDRVVVVSLYDPEAKVDRISLAEARAGARRARVGFVALNVLDRRASEALTRKLGVLSAPAFFLYRRPGTLVMRIDGFADRDLVAQAARGALGGR